MITFESFATSLVFVGGVIFTTLIFSILFIWLFNIIIEKLVGWGNKELRENILWAIKHKKDIEEYAKIRKGD